MWLGYILKWHILFHYQISYQDARGGKKNNFSNKVFYLF